MRNLPVLASSSLCSQVATRSRRPGPYRCSKKLIGQRVTLENHIRGLLVVFSARLPLALSPAFITQALSASEGVDGLYAATRGLIAARDAVLRAVVAIDEDMRRLVRAFETCQQLISALSRIAINQVSSTTQTASPNAVIGGYGRCSMRPQTSYSRVTKSRSTAMLAVVAELSIRGNL